MPLKLQFFYEFTKNKGVIPMPTSGYSMFGDKGFRVADMGFELAEMAAKEYLK